MPTIGSTELLIILVIVILLFGVDKFSKAMGELGRATRGFRDSLAADEAAKAPAPGQRPSSSVREVLDQARALDADLRFAFALNALLDLYSITSYRLEQEIGVNRTTIDRWRKGETKPQRETLDRVLACITGLSSHLRLEMLALAGHVTTEAGVDLPNPPQVYLSCHGDDLVDERKETEAVLCHPMLAFNVEVGDPARAHERIAASVRHSDFLVLVQGRKWVAARRVEHAATQEERSQVTGLYFQRQDMPLPLEAEAERFRDDVGAERWVSFSNPDALATRVCVELWEALTAEARAGRARASLQGLAAIYLVTRLPTGERVSLPALLRRLAESKSETEAQVIEPGGDMTQPQPPVEPSPQAEPGPSRPRRWKRTHPEEPKMVRIPAGKFLMGTDRRALERAGVEWRDWMADEQPQHTLYLPEYYLAETPVTNAQYLAFVQATGQAAPYLWKNNRPPDGKEDHPVNYLAWRDALAYCRWLAEITGRPYRLPTEAEWEKGARGTDGRIWPWGNGWDASRCNTHEGGKGDTTPVGAYPQGASPYGLLDMVGNVWEWTRSLWGKEWDKPAFKYPYDPRDGRENLDADDSVRRVLRGGSFDYSRRDARCAVRNHHSPLDWYRDRGVRVAAAPFSLASGL